MFKFSYFCDEMNKTIVQVNMFKSIDAALAYAESCGSNATAELWDGK